MIEFIFLVALPYLFTWILPISLAIIFGLPLLISMIITVKEKGIGALLHD